MDAMQMLGLAAIAAAVLLARALGYRMLLELTVPLLLFALAGIPDCLATIHFAIQNPALEGNPLVRPFLSSGWLMAVGIFLWVFGWLSAAELALRRKLHTLAMLIPLALFIGHAWGFSTWLHRIPHEMLVEIVAVTVATVAVLYYLCANEHGRKEKQGNCKEGVGKKDIDGIGVSNEKKAKQQ